jgi:Domain of unknown function (DUF5658)
MALIQVFVYLQLLDLVTTLLGLRLGAAEASPFVRLLMHAGPAAGIAASKVLALALGAFCVYTRRFGLIRIASYWYGGLVAWNLILLLAMPGHLGR